MAKKQQATRVEHDLLGEVRLPRRALWGAQTQRALENFPVGSQRTVGQFPTMVAALAMVKQAAAAANVRAGLLEERIGGAIAAAADKVLAGGFEDQFPIHYLHGGGGTSANMNANEVLANLAEEALGGRRGQYRLVHPNNHVNLKQSTNDVYPTACHVAAILRWRQGRPAVMGLAATVRRKSRRPAKVPKIARTCLQDAVAITFGDYFGGVAAAMERGTARVDAAVDALHAVALGGTICGRTADAPAGYRRAVVPALRRVTGDRRYRQAEDLFDAAQNIDDLAAVTASMDLLAAGIVKFARDLRLMSSGPEAGLGEIHLPAVQPGSSIMPGKINPVMPEHAIQLCWKVSASHMLARKALENGELDLNVWESPAAFAVIESMELLESAALALTPCVAGLRIDAGRNERNTRTIIPLLTRLMHAHGYSAVSDVCKAAAGDIQRLRVLLAERFGEDGAHEARRPASRRRPGGGRR